MKKVYLNLRIILARIRDSIKDISGRSLLFIIKHKILLYFILVLFVVASLAFYLYDEEDPLSANLLTGAIELLITVTLVDGLINIANNKDRNAKFILINTPIATNIKLGTIKEISVIGNLFKYPFSENEQTIDIFAYDNQQLAELTDNILASQEYLNFLDLVESSPKEAVAILKDFEQGSDTYREWLGKLMNDIEPYASPEIKENIMMAGVRVTSITRISHDIYEIILKAKKEAKTDTAPLDAIWKMLTPNHRSSVDDMIRSHFAFLINIHAKAEHVDLHLEA